jgi:sugar phosphate isomerase/epimerase
MKRPELLVKLSLIGVFITLLSLTACKSPQENQASVEESPNEVAQPFFKLSLAQWSLHKQIYTGEMSPLDFAQKASELGFEGIEYVSGLYKNELKKGNDPQVAMQNLLVTLKAKSEEYNVQNVLIMVDGEGNLASPDEVAKTEAIDSHKKWVDAAEFLGCHSIRVNLFGSNDPEEWTINAAEGLSKLAEYAATKNINILVENHGSLSSNAALLAGVMNTVNMPNCGTLPDFGNFCIQRGDSGCIEEYDKYQGVKEMMPFAIAVSAKSYDFDEDGNETTIDYKKMLQIVKDEGYTSFIGVEYEGSRLTEEEGILATKKLLLRLAKQIN